MIETLGAAVAVGGDLLAHRGLVGRFAAARSAATLRSCARVSKPTLVGFAPDGGGELAAVRILGPGLQMKPRRAHSGCQDGLLLPILLYCTDTAGSPMLGPVRPGPEGKECLRAAYHNIPVMVRGMRGAAEHATGPPREARLSMAEPLSEKTTCASCGSEMARNARLCHLCGSETKQWKNSLSYFAKIAGAVAIVASGATFMAGQAAIWYDRLMWQDAVKAVFF
jgi:hypothetical protein